MTEPIVKRHDLTCPAENEKFRGSLKNFLIHIWHALALHLFTLLLKCCCVPLFKSFQRFRVHQKFWKNVLIGKMHFHQGELDTKIKIFLQFFLRIVLSQTV